MKELSTVNKLYLELSHFVTAKTEKQIELEKNQITTDEKVLSNLILLGADNKVGEISSGLTTDFVKKTNAFNVRQQDGKEYRVTVKIDEI